MAIVIGANFGYCVLAAVGISFQCIMAGSAVAAARKKYNVNFPDNGGGRFSDKLSDEDWVKFNNIKRVSDNYSEQVGIVLSMLIMAGLFQPKLAASLGATYIFGRFLFGRGYISKGPEGRKIGYSIAAFSLLGMIITAVYNAAMITYFA
ncbi:hypothetical protein COEREDRAFT_82895 [Coemansia reversa NRRL 1564]|uniref:Membrane-associated proteins in eicosanoid and glutathione metabolism n=1 Tax=Coemansia reversa (strain ATCC 12441 / NRRL 1564) TaxID=763665 RepID=A0A2G5B5E5_COERN|nr:hypothetical protein COEREDRAFT_82895 [Coemansia reversa NRRL 1564]|eukprot:PIA14224.1 hypothetical protein COEREDRAFT_82895 [Coemansia reversa NRRL 1564]